MAKWNGASVVVDVINYFTFWNDLYLLTKSKKYNLVKL